jgi:hypothetical protein
MSTAPSEEPATVTPPRTTLPGPVSFLDRLSEAQMAVLVILGGLLLYIPLAGS